MLPSLNAITFYDVALLAAMHISWPELNDAVARVEAAERAMEQRKQRFPVIDPGMFRPGNCLE
jgi:type III secretory pathway component EscR